MLPLPFPKVVFTLLFTSLALGVGCPASTSIAPSARTSSFEDLSAQGRAFLQAKGVGERTQNQIVADISALSAMARRQGFGAAPEIQLELQRLEERELFKAIIEKRVAAKSTNEKSLRAFYKAHRAHYFVPEKRQVVRMRTKGLTSTDAALARGWRKRLARAKTETQWRKLARKGFGKERQNDGVVPVVQKHDAKQPDIARAAFALKEKGTGKNKEQADVSDVLKDEQFYYVLKLVDVQPRHIASFESKEKDIRASFTASLRRQALEELVDETQGRLRPRAPANGKVPQLLTELPIEYWQDTPVEVKEGPKSASLSLGSNDPVNTFFNKLSNALTPSAHAQNNLGGGLGNNAAVSLPPPSYVSVSGQIKAVKDPFLVMSRTNPVVGSSVADNLALLFVPNMQIDPVGFLPRDKQATFNGRITVTAPDGSKDAKVNEKVILGKKAPFPMTGEPVVMNQLGTWTVHYAVTPANESAVRPTSTTLEVLVELIPGVGDAPDTYRATTRLVDVTAQPLAIETAFPDLQVDLVGVGNQRTVTGANGKYAFTFEVRYPTEIYAVATLPLGQRQIGFPVGSVRTTVFPNHGNTVLESNLDIFIDVHDLEGRISFAAEDWSSR